MSQRVGAKRRPMINSAKCESGWGDLSTRALLETKDRHPTPPLISFASTQRASFARLAPSRGG
jgi:hypothetical protein